MAVTLVRIQLLSKTSTEFATDNPVLLDGEVGVANAGSAIPVLKIGDGVRPWSALPDIVAAGAGADYVAGPVNTLPPGQPATVVIDNGVSPPTISFGIPSGATGPQGGIGPVGPQGPIGNTGATGPANTLAIGVVTTGAPGSAAAATITGAAPNQILNLTIPTGAQGPQGIQGPPGADGIGAPGIPTALVGLVAINGVANSYVRSDGAPALSQAIAPTWTEKHIFTKSWVNGSLDFALSLNSASPTLAFMETDQAANEKGWLFSANSKTFQLFTLNDAGAFGATVFNVLRGTGTAIDSVTFPSSVVFTKGGAGQNSAIQLESITPAIAWNETDAAINNRRWDVVANGEQMRYRVLSDDGVTVADWLDVDRTGTVVDSVTFAERLIINSSIDACINIRAASPYISFDTVAAVNLGFIQCSAAAMSLYHATGVMNFYTAGVSRMILEASGHLNVGSWIKSGSGVGNGNLSNYLAWGPGGGSFGSCYVTGASGGYSGIAIDDGSIRPVFMSAGGYFGVYSQAGSYWAWQDDGTKFLCAKPVHAPSFNATSSRNIKRETGKPTRAADILARLRPIMYRLLSKNAPEQLGMIAEEVRDVCPQLSDGKTISYDRLAILLLADWQASRGIVV